MLTVWRVNLEECMSIFELKAQNPMVMEKK
jgi:hypothetical protein